MGRPAMVEDPAFIQVAQGSFMGIPYLTWFAITIFLIAFVIQKYTAFGRHMFAIGENEMVLRSIGVNVDRKKIMVFTWSALCSSIAGIFGALRLNRGEVVIGSGYLFYTITAVVVGGTALWGGRGGVVQSLVGVFIVTIIQNSMILLGINPYIQSAVQGVLIILAVTLTVIRGKKIIIK
ncbi:MAG: ABC transporter permease, partial [Lachnospiraceae bacterium]|nr:ABC transporter permease [Lachnospiraceae bacterium]